MHICKLYHQACEVIKTPGKDMLQQALQMINYYFEEV